MRATAWLFSVAVTAALTLCVASARADETDAGTARLDLSVPDIPAASAVGLDSTKVQQPGSVKDFAASLINAINGDGTIVTGVGIEIAPIDLAISGKHDKHEQSAGPLIELVRSLRFSFASAAAPSGSKTTTFVATGARLGWVYNADTDIDFVTCLALDAPDASVDPGAAPPIAFPHVKTPGGMCRQVFQAAHLTNSSVEVASSFSWTGGNALDSLQPKGLSAWASAAWGINHVSSDRARRWVVLMRAAADLEQLTDARMRPASVSAERTSAIEAALSQDFLDLHPGSGGQPLEQQRAALQSDVSSTGAIANELQTKASESWGFEPLVYGRYDAQHQAHGLDGEKDLTVAARLTFAKPTFTLFAEGGAKWKDLTSVAGKHQVGAPVGIGGDVRISDGTWLGLYFGFDARTGQILSLANLKWSMSSTRPY
jgi:hypothetical protein